MSCPHQIDPIMGRTRYWPDGMSPATAAGTQMQPRAQHACQAPIACDDKNGVPRAAERRQFPPKRRTMRIRIVAEHHAAQSPWQARDDRPRIC
jgi:hypothetical protein